MKITKEELRDLILNGKDISNIDYSHITDMSFMFYDCSELTSIPLLNTSNVTNMSYMFYNCNELTTIPLLDTSKVTNMSYMFDGCSKLTSIPNNIKYKFDVSIHEKLINEYPHLFI